MKNASQVETKLLGPLLKQHLRLIHATDQEPGSKRSKWSKILKYFLQIPSMGGFQKVAPFAPFTP